MIVAAKERPRWEQTSRRTAPALQSELAVCLWFPHFALNCELQRHPDFVSRPTAVLAAEATRRLWQVSPIARSAGIKPGMTVSQAIGLCPLLSLWEADPVHYDEQFSNLLAALSDVSPVIEPAELGRVYIGVDGLERLYGSPEQQIRVIWQAVGELREAGYGQRGDAFLSARLGWGRGKFTAWVAATRAKPGEPVIVSDDTRAKFIASQPVAVLRIDPDMHRRLWQLGIKQLSDLTRLPEMAVVSQFGTVGRHLWSSAAGKVIEPVVGKEMPEPIAATIDFPNPVVDQGILVRAIDRLIERALRHPQRVGWRILEVQARARQENRTSWLVRVALRDATADRDHIAEPLKARLVQTPPTSAVETLVVEFTSFTRGTNELQLFARDANSSARAGRRGALRAAINEIKMRYRHSGLYQIVEVQPRSRLPERRYALIDYDPQ
jgi:nucleotidyltransferase/DNA polymerase involved in DNA repair